MSSYVNKFKVQVLKKIEKWTLCFSKNWLYFDKNVYLALIEGLFRNDPAKLWY